MFIHMRHSRAEVDQHHTARSHNAKDDGTQMDTLDISDISPFHYGRFLPAGISKHVAHLYDEMSNEALFPVRTR